MTTMPDPDARIPGERNPHHEPQSMTRPAALLFDCDGTLLLTGELHFQAISHAVALLGVQLPRDWYMDRTGLSRDVLFAQFQSEFGRALDVPRAVADSIAQTVLQATKARENPSVAAIERFALGRLPMAVVTNSEAPIATAFLAEAGLSHVFAQLITREDAQRPKPAPDLYLTAATRLGVAAMACLVLEDSDEGLCVARAAGMAGCDVRRPEWPDQARDLMQLVRSGPRL